MNLVITNAVIITMNKEREIINNGAVVIEGDVIKEVGDSATLLSKYPHYEKFDAAGKYVTPGLINTHTHLFQGLLKGLGDDRVLVDWFRKVTGPSAVELTHEDCYLAAQLGALESLRSGSTCLLDFMYPHRCSGLSEAIIKALGESGMRSVFARGYIDYGEEDGVPPQIIENYADALLDVEKLFDKYQGSYGGRMNIWVAPCMIWTQSKEGLIETKKLSQQKGIPISIHISETPFELENSLKRFGKKDLEFLESINFLGPNVLAVHCVYSDERDIRILKHYDVKVSHNPVSNMYLSSGVAPIPQMLMAGIKVGLATDGPASNNNQSMLAVLKYASLLHKVSTKDPTIVTAEKILEMATIDGAGALGMEEQVGSLEAGKKADIAIFNLKTPFATPVLHPVSTLVYSAVGNEAESVIIDGEFVMKNNKILTIDEQKVLEKVQENAEKLSLRAKTRQFAQRPWRTLAF